jgi:hypothetical protein
MSNFWKSLAKINKTLNYLPVTPKKTFICCDHWTAFYALQKPDKHNHKPSVGFSQQSLQLKELMRLRQKTNREKPQLQSPLGIYFEKPKIAETQIYQGKS